MDIRIKQNCVALLNELRDVYQGQLDTSVIAEIEEVIAALKDERCDCSEAGSSVDWSYRALKVIGEVVRIVTDISDLMS